MIDRSLCCRLLLPALLYLPVMATVHAADLMDAYKLAQESDPQYRQVAANKRAVEESKPQAYSQLLPSIGIDANNYYRKQDVSGSSGFGLGNFSYSTRGANVNLRQPIFHWDRFLQITKANNSIKQADAELTLAQQQLIVRVAQAYFNALAAHDNLEFARAEKRALGRQLEQTKQRFDVGLTAITDVQEAQAGFDRAVAQEIAAENDIDNTREAMREITGQYIDNLKRLSDKMPLVKPKPADINAWTDIALQENLDVIAAQRAVDQSREEVDIQQSGHYPTLDLVSQYGYDRNGGRFGFTSTRGGAIGVELNVPIYQGGYVNSKTREAQQRLQEQLERLEQARRQAHRSTRESYLGVISGISQIKALNQAVISSETALQATQAGFEVGTRTAVDVVASERATYQSKRDYARARYNYLINTLQLKLASGTLSTDDLAQINTWLK